MFAPVRRYLVVLAWHALSPPLELSPTPTYVRAARLGVNVGALEVSRKRACFLSGAAAFARTRTCGEAQDIVLECRHENTRTTLVPPPARPLFLPPAAPLHQETRADDNHSHAVERRHSRGAGGPGLLPPPKLSSHGGRSGFTSVGGGPWTRGTCGALRECLFVGQTRVCAIWFRGGWHFAKGILGQGVVPKRKAEAVRRESRGLEVHSPPAALNTPRDFNLSDARNELFFFFFSTYISFFPMIDRCWHSTRCELLLLLVAGLPAAGVRQRLARQSHSSSVVCTAWLWC